MSSLQGMNDKLKEKEDKDMLTSTQLELTKDELMCIDYILCLAIKKTAEEKEQFHQKFDEAFDEMYERLLKKLSALEMKICSITQED